VVQEKAEKLRSESFSKLYYFSEYERKHMANTNVSEFNSEIFWDCSRDPKTGVVYYFSVKTGEILFTERRV
jgi:hypothetical protein